MSNGWYARTAGIMDVNVGGQIDPGSVVGRDINGRAGSDSPAFINEQINARPFAMNCMLDRARGERKRHNPSSKGTHRKNRIVQKNLNKLKKKRQKNTVGTIGKD
jgi:hypothetical protein